MNVAKLPAAPIESESDDGQQAQRGPLKPAHSCFEAGFRPHASMVHTLDPHTASQSEYLFGCVQGSTLQLIRLKVPKLQHICCIPDRPRMALLSAQKLDRTERPCEEEPLLRGTWSLSWNRLECCPGQVEGMLVVPAFSVLQGQAIGPVSAGGGWLAAVARALSSGDLLGCRRFFLCEISDKGSFSGSLSSKPFLVEGIGCVWGGIWFSTERLRTHASSIRNPRGPRPD